MSVAENQRVLRETVAEPPIIHDSAQQAGVDTFERYLKMIAHKSQPITIAYEINNLRERFRALSKRTQNEDLNLRPLFLHAVLARGQLVLPEVVVIPHTLLDDTPHKDRLVYADPLKGAMQTPFRYNRAEGFNHGTYMLDVENGRSYTKVALPFLMLDSGMLDSISPYKPEALLSALQALAQYATPDMLHDYMHVHRGYDSSAPRAKQGFSDENYRTLSHARTMRYMRRNMSHRAVLESHIETIHYECLHIAERMNAVGHSYNYMYDTIDYFVNAAAYCMGQFMRLDHPLFKKLSTTLYEVGFVEKNGNGITPQSDHAQVYQRCLASDTAMRTIERYEKSGRIIYDRKSIFASNLILNTVLMLPQEAYAISPQLRPENEPDIDGLDRRTLRFLDVLKKDAPAP